VVTREVAEIALVLYNVKSREQSAGPATAIALDQSRMLATCDAEVADSEKRLERIIEQIDDGTYVDAALSAPDAAFQAIKHFHQAINNRLAVARAGPLAEGQGHVGESRISRQAEIERARGQERLKKLILNYEKAYLKWLTRKRAHPWW
jgi:hypothetical protein